jgi:hypothetical protein
VSIGGSPIGASPIGGGPPLNPDPPPGLGVTARSVAAAAQAEVSVTAGTVTARSVAAAAEAEVSVTAGTATTISGGPVLGILRGRPAQVDSILAGLDDEMIAGVASLIRDVAPFAEIGASPEEQWRQFMASTVSDAVRGATAPFMEHIQSRQADMDEMFATVFAMAESIGDGAQPTLDPEPSPQEIKSWSAVIMFWIATAAAGYWMGSSPQLGVIFTALVGLAVMYDRCFE